MCCAITWQVSLDRDEWQVSNVLSSNSAAAMLLLLLTRSTVQQWCFHTCRFMSSHVTSFYLNRVCCVLGRGHGEFGRAPRSPEATQFTVALTSCSTHTVQMKWDRMKRDETSDTRTLLKLNDDDDEGGGRVVMVIVGRIQVRDTWYRWRVYTVTDRCDAATTPDVAVWSPTDAERCRDNGCRGRPLRRLWAFVRLGQASSGRRWPVRSRALSGVQSRPQTTLSTVCHRRRPSVPPYCRPRYPASSSSASRISTLCLKKTIPSPNYQQ